MNYALPTLILSGTILAFFGAARGRFRGFGTAQLLLQIVVAFPLVFSGVVLHFFFTDVSASMIPPVFPERHLLVLITGLLEILGALGLFLPALQRQAAVGIALMMVAVFPANVYAAGHVIGGLRMPGIPLRLAMQVVYTLMVLLAGYGLPKPKIS